MNYELLGKLYYKNTELFKSTYMERKDSPYAMSLNLDVYESEAFYINVPDATLQSISIYKKFSQLARLCAELPSVAYKSYERKCLIDEIILSNDIEGVRSTRKEIIKVLDEEKPSAKRNRFDGMVKKYVYLLDDSPSYEVTLNSSIDIRSLYDDMVLDEIRKEDWPDGDIFRKDVAEVVSGTQQVKHVGLYPESKIISYIDTVLSLFKNDAIPQLYKIAILHYFIGYIHPFYDGNGRLSRFISSFLLKQEFNSLVALRLSYTIKNNKSDYYKAFDIINDKNNMGDLTPFITYFADIVEKSIDSLIAKLSEGKDILDFYYGLLFSKYGDLDPKEQKKTSDVLWYFIQNELFSSDPIDKKFLAKQLQTSPETAHHYIEGLISAGAPIKIETLGRKFVYKLDFHKLSEFLSKDK